MSRMSRDDYLFCSENWSSLEDRHRRGMLSEIDQVEGNRLLNTSTEDLTVFFVKKFWIEAPVLLEEQIVADQNEVQLDVSQDQNRFIRDRSRPFYVRGTEVVITVPFRGEGELFKVQPNTYTTSPPRGVIWDNALHIMVSGTNLEPDGVRAQIDRALSEIKQYLEWLTANANGLNRQLHKLAGDRIEQRRNKLLADQSLVSSLGFPLKERPDAPKTFTAPEVRRRIKPIMPPASTAPYAPEPALSMDDYEHILSVMDNMVLVMERSPSAFSTMDEEALRWHFLVQLNGHYQGQATGETFNYEGKTDILIRANGRNIFVAECKYWAGPKKLTETIDQLLGYTSWRDTKLAIVIFNRQKNFSHVLETIPRVVEQHPNQKRCITVKDVETGFRYVFGHRDDPNRELTLSVLAYDVPS